ncbi:hypothetical protein COLO4_11690 [Corchorus olitorius]|uniref:Legume lectin domain-containing protein n=1 Tax=Corchorus olitorius TaxID=93759 RepID=A0A1R3K3I8_9ROSI|nr:hypothetical protein COLO4_11690 [Corchorus olitorius]
MTNIFYQGDAQLAVGTVEFNLINYINRVGWATYSDRVLLWDSETGKLSDFTSRFSFIVDTRNASVYGHGICFFLAPVGFQIPPNSAGGFLGLFNTTTSFSSSSNQIVSIEFDSFENTEWDPPGIGGHVGINNNSISSAVYTRWNASNHSKDTATVSISYNSTTKNLSVSWSYFQTNDPQENSSLSMQIDLMKVLPENVMVGFSAATGMNVERHILQSWEFHSSLEKQDTKGKTERRIKIVLGSVIPVSVLVIGTVIGFIIWRLRKEREMETCETRNFGSINDDDFERGAGPRRFSFKDLVSATNNFSEKRRLGEGGFGAVYRGHKSADPRETDETGLVELVWDLYGQGKIVSAVDEKLNQDFDEKQVECLMITGLWCAHPDSRSRPSIRQVIQVLNFETALPNLPTKMPVPIFRSPPTPDFATEPMPYYSTTEPVL